MIQQQHSLFEPEIETPIEVKQPKLTVEKCDICTKPTDYDFGCHGITDGKVYSLFFCEKHYNAKMKGKRHE